MNKFKSIFTTILAGIFVFGLSVYSFILPDKEISVAENRPLQQFPELSFESVMSDESDKRFMSQFEVYTQEQFPLRDEFRRLKSGVVLNLFNQKDNNGYFMSGNYIFKNNNKYNAENVDYALDRINFYYENLLSENNKAYIAVIPDKSYYNSDKLALRLDYGRLFNAVKERTAFAEYIDLTDKLSLQSYYATDTHWRQEKIINVADFILSSMGAESLDSGYTVKSADKRFMGVYARQTSFKTTGDLMNYVTSPLLEQAVLFDYSTNSQAPIYNFSKIDSDEPYDMFMSYAKVGLITLERKVKATGRELIVFRDSFGSSIGPLLLSGYDKITFIDTRQMLPGVVKRNVEFNNQDVLFLYSTSVINDTKEMK